METPSRPTAPGDRPARAVVTFGRSTYLGSSLASALSSTGRWVITVVDPSPNPRDDTSPNPAHYQSDFSSPRQLLSAVADAAVVFHFDPTTAAAGDFAAGHALAVTGTRNLIAACREAGVGRIVYTGSADVVVGAGAGDIREIDESAPYPDEFTDEMNQLRVQVEKMILNANGRDGLVTCALRPSGVFGPRDPYLIPLIVSLARSPFSKFIIGSGSNLCDFTFVENVVHANVCAYQALRSSTDSVAGKVFFVTNHEPIETLEFISIIVESLGYQRPTIHLPARFVLLAALFIEMICKKLGLYGGLTQLMSPTIIYDLSQARTFSSSRARNILGYSPVTSLEDAIAKTVESFGYLADSVRLSRQKDANVSSKVDKILGDGAVADILLWRDEKRTFTYVSMLLFMYYWFLLTERTFVSSAASFLLVMSMALAIQGKLPLKVFGFAIGRVKLNHFKVSEPAIRSIFSYAALLWNEGCHILNLVAKGDDWNVFAQVMATLLLLKIVINISLRALIGSLLASLFIVFIVYEQCEEEIDRIVHAASVKICNIKCSILPRMPTT